MIKIEHPELETIAKEYFDSIKNKIIERANGFKIIFEILLSSNQKQRDLKLVKNSQTLNNTLVQVILNKGKYLPMENNNNRKENLTSYITLKNSKSVFKNKSIIKTLISLCEELVKEEVIEKIILAKPNKNETESFDLKSLKAIDESLRNKFNLSDKLFVVVNKIIDYGILENTKKVNNGSIKIGYWLTQRLGVNTCPYCNRSPIHTVFDNTESNKELIRPTLDHFYPKSKNPFLALSFYNLIPSCYYCNSSLKGKTDMDESTHLNPYIDGFGDDAKFSASLLGDSLSYEIKLNQGNQISEEKRIQIFGKEKKESNSIEEKKKEKKEGNANLFKLKEIYQVHRDLVGELVVKADEFKAKRENIKEFYSSLATNDSQLYQFHFGNYLDEKDHNKRPLAKLTKDIVTEIIPNHF